MNAHHTVVIVRDLGLQSYLAVWQAMRQFTDQRDNDTVDEFWLIEHPPVFTQGQNGKPEHLLSASDVPVVQSDRGGQITYHGPGQLIVYTLVDLRRKKLNVREMVTCLEQSVIHCLDNYSIQARTQCGAPGVYIQHQKICSVGLRVRRGCCFHGLALNIQMDMKPFSQINPCGFPGLEMTQLAEWVRPVNTAVIKTKLVKHLMDSLGYTSLHGNTDFKS